MQQEDNIKRDLYEDYISRKYEYPFKIVLRNNRKINGIWLSNSSSTLDAMEELVNSSSDSYKILLDIKTLRPVVINVFDIQTVELHKKFFKNIAEYVSTIAGN